MLGVQKISITIEKESEKLKFETVDQKKTEDAFYNFKNMLSGPSSDVYSKFFSST